MAAVLMPATPGAADAFALTELELYELTRYRRPAAQMRVLKELGVPAQLLRDGTVRVLRMHLMQPATPGFAKPASRPKLNLS